MRFFLLHIGGPLWTNSFFIRKKNDSNSGGRWGAEKNGTKKHWLLILFQVRPTARAYIYVTFAERIRFGYIRHSEDENFVVHMVHANMYYLHISKWSRLLSLFSLSVRSFGTFLSYQWEKFSFHPMPVLVAMTSNRICNTKSTRK